ncbi:MAG: hypothetical protein M3O85_00450 [Acidobacteriota bacterium]|nr:hypothetical protein [Acidobacteriota bacterium]
MRVGELKQRLEKFHADLDEHFRFWCRSLDQTLPDFPVRDVDFLNAQMRSLARQLGALRPYLQQLVDNGVMYHAATGTEWDIYDSAVSNDVAQRKGRSIETALSQIQQALGVLDGVDDQKEIAGPKFEKAAAAPTPEPGKRGDGGTHIYILSGAHSRVNVGSEDHSVNRSEVTSTQLFEEVRAAVRAAIVDDSEKQEILRRLDELECARDASAFQKYNDLIAVAANHMALLGPFIPALTDLVSRYLK